MAPARAIQLRISPVPNFSFAGGTTKEGFLGRGDLGMTVGHDFRSLRIRDPSLGH
jgi:hypothetical protein